MRRADNDPGSEVERFTEIGCLRCGTISFGGGMCQPCLEAIGELRALDQEFTAQLTWHERPWHPSRAARIGF